MAQLIGGPCDGDFWLGPQQGQAGIVFPKRPHATHVRRGESGALYVYRDGALCFERFVTADEDWWALCWPERRQGLIERVVNFVMGVK